MLKPVWPLISFLLGVYSPDGAQVQSFHLSNVVSTSDLDIVRGKSALAWVGQRNAEVASRLKADPRYSEIYHTVLAEQYRTYAGTQVTVAGDWAYRIDKSPEYPFGKWQRQPARQLGLEGSRWATILDFAEFADQGFAIHSAFYSPSGRYATPILVNSTNPLRVRLIEYDLRTARPAENGFNTETDYGGGYSWLDDNTVVLSPPSSTSVDGSTTPAKVLVWKRGEASPRTFLSGDTSTRQILPTWLVKGRWDDMVLWQERVSNDEARFYLQKGGVKHPTTLPTFYASNVIYGDHVILYLENDWHVSGQTHRSGSVVAVPFSEISSPHPRVTTIWEPTASQAFYDIKADESGIMIVGMENVQGRAWIIDLVNGSWRTRDVLGLPRIATLRTGLNTQLIAESFLTPKTIYDIDFKMAVARRVASLSRRIDSEMDFVEEQLWAISKDGTKIPYTLVRSKRSKRSSPAPTIVSGYGAYGIPSTPGFLQVSEWWLRQGGVFVQANIRGGGEFNGWDARKEKRQVVYEDFAAVLTDLSRRGISSSARTGITGHSAGGALVGVMLNQYPNLFNAAVIANGALDLLRPDETQSGEVGQVPYWGSLKVPHERGYLEATSPVQNVRFNPSMPEPFVHTATSDTRVLPTQSRRFVHRMLTVGNRVLYYEHEEGGHGVGNTPAQMAETLALDYTYFAQRLIEGRANSRVLEQAGAAGHD